MRRGWILLLLLAALALPVSAADVLEQERQILQVDSLTDPLSGQTREALEDYSPASQTDPASAILDIFNGRRISPSVRCGRRCRPGRCC